MLYVVLFFESVCFPTIVALGIRGLGRHYKRGSGWIVGGVLGEHTILEDVREDDTNLGAGGACVPPLTGKAADIHNNTGVAMVVPLAVRTSSLP